MTRPSAATTGTTTMPARYEPADIESVWMQRWLDAGHFDAEVDESRPPYSIVIPPPNVTGALHMGHALNGAIQDALIRFHRMRGYNALWLPGTDHAGIATQNVVEKELRKEGLSRHDLGRERFLERVRQWKDEHGSTIIGQLKRLGCSLDFRRERFTMDGGYAKSVLHTFVQLYCDGHIYRDKYLVNWCGRCHTAISDLEVRQQQLKDEMFEVDYPFADGDGFLTIATVRPETIVADVAVAVHPTDERHVSNIGRMVHVPLTDRTVPVIADEYVDPAFGTGALKITPGHDPNDFEIGNRHGLERLSAIESNLKMSSLAGRFAGMGIDEARTAMVDELEGEGLLRGREPYPHNVPHCDRCGTRIEPLISLQWFCNMTELAKPAIAAVASGDVRFIPESASSVFHMWMDDIRPWCLSRQLWWGHQLPVWYCEGPDHHVHVSVAGPGDAPCETCGSTTWTRDEDVLDTWFSSGLWDSATLGWPDDTPELRYWHPTNVLVTARDIINLWVARMMMMSYRFLGERPFADVYIHSTIQAADGRRMSKSLGTGIDPLELIDEFGADATRYGLLTMSSTQDVRFNRGKIQEGLDLANKLWNASRLVSMFASADVLRDARGAHPSMTCTEDRWILSRLGRVTKQLTTLLETYEFAMYTKVLYSFVWGELCDWYLEAVKERLRSDDPQIVAEVTGVLGYVLDTTLRLVHPVMPHVSEEIILQLWGEGEHVAVSAWPTVHEGCTDADAEAAFGKVQEMVSRLRSLRQSAGLAPRDVLQASLAVTGDEGRSYDQNRSIIALLANVTWVDGGEGVVVPFAGASLSLVDVDRDVLRGRLEVDLTTARSEAKRAQAKLGNERFVMRAPQELVEAEQQKIDEHTQRATELEAVLAQLG